MWPMTLRLVRISAKFKLVFSLFINLFNNMIMTPHLEAAEGGIFLSQFHLPESTLKKGGESISHHSLSIL